MITPTWLELLNDKMPAFKNTISLDSSQLKEKLEEALEELKILSSLVNLPTFDLFAITHYPFANHLKEAYKDLDLPKDLLTSIDSVSPEFQRLAQTYFQVPTSERLLSLFYILIRHFSYTLDLYAQLLKQELVQLHENGSKEKPPTTKEFELKQCKLASINKLIEQTQRLLNDPNQFSMLIFYRSMVGFFSDMDRDNPKWKDGVKSKRASKIVQAWYRCADTILQAFHTKHLDELFNRFNLSANTPLSVKSLIQGGALFPVKLTNSIPLDASSQSLPKFNETLKSLQELFEILALLEHAPIGYDLANVTLLKKRKTIATAEIAKLLHDIIMDSNCNEHIPNAMARIKNLIAHLDERYSRAWREEGLTSAKVATLVRLLNYIVDFFERPSHHRTRSYSEPPKMIASLL